MCISKYELKLREVNRKIDFQGSSNQDGIWITIMCPSFTPIDNTNTHIKMFFNCFLEYYRHPPINTTEENKQFLLHLPKDEPENIPNQTNHLVTTDKNHPTSHHREKRMVPTDAPGVTLYPLLITDQPGIIIATVPSKY